MTGPRCVALVSGLLAIASQARRRRGTEIRLWPGRAPGSETWTIAETTTRSPAGDRIIANVSDPTVTVFLPDAAAANGSRRGGGARRRAADSRLGQRRHSGSGVAERQGIAAFVLKYRTLQTQPRKRPAALAPPRPPVAWAAAPRQEMTIPERQRESRAQRPAAGRSAAHGHRGCAAGLAAGSAATPRCGASTPGRVGIMGFSAGGGVAVGTALPEKTDASPDFLVSLLRPSLMDVNVRPDTPPLFIAVGATHFNVTNGCLALFAAWKAAGRPRRSMSTTW
jgi:hypothetical protein